MDQLLIKYLNDKKHAWAPTTLRSEASRLKAIVRFTDTSAENLWELLIDTQSPYTRVTTWTRMINFYQYLLDENLRSGENKFEKFRRKNARMFKNVYETRVPKIAFEEAVKRIKTLPTNERHLANQIICTGERLSESIQPLLKNEQVIGKGSKRRHTFRPEASGQPNKSNKSSFRRALATIGLKPHDLRKLFATRLVALGAKEADLLKAMGWSSMETAKRYLQPKSDKELEEMFKKVQAEVINI